MTSCSGESNGGGVSRTVLTTLKMAVLAPMASESVPMTMALNPGALARVRMV